MNPLSYQEIGAWRDLLMIDVTPSEISTIKALDRLYLIENAPT